MDRIGHSSTRAAMIYIHGSDARQHEIADTLSQLARQELDPVLKAPPRPPWREAIGHAAGTQEQARLVRIMLRPTGLGSDVGIWVVGLGGLEPTDLILIRLFLPCPPTARRQLTDRADVS